MDHLVMDTGERNYLRYLQQRAKYCRTTADRMHGENALIMYGKAQCFKEAARAFLRMIDERMEAESGME